MPARRPTGSGQSRGPQQGRGRQHGRGPWQGRGRQHGRGTRPGPETQQSHNSDRGSITPLAIGFVVIALLLASLIAALTDLHMARRELQGLADSAALAASDSFEPAPGDDPGLVFSPPAAKRAASRYVSAVPTPRNMGDLRLSADADGTHSVRIRIEAHYSPALLSPFVPGLIDLHATASARGALRLD